MESKDQKITLTRAQQLLSELLHSGEDPEKVIQILHRQLSSETKKSLTSIGRKKLNVSRLENKIEQSQLKHSQLTSELTKLKECLSEYKLEKTEIIKNLSEIMSEIQDLRNKDNEAMIIKRELLLNESKVVQQHQNVLESISSLDQHTKQNLSAFSKNTQTLFMEMQKEFKNILRSYKSQLLETNTQFTEAQQEVADELGQQIFPKCGVCMDALTGKATAFSCGHIYCDECEYRLDSCPICSSDIAIRLQVFINFGSKVSQSIKWPSGFNSIDFTYYRALI